MNARRKPLQVDRARVEAIVDHLIQLLDEFDAPDEDLEPEQDWSRDSEGEPFFDPRENVFPAPTWGP